MADQIHNHQYGEDCTSKCPADHLLMNNRDNHIFTGGVTDLATDPRNVGHGHVFPRPDGMKAKCGGPSICPNCASDLAKKDSRRPSTEAPNSTVGLTDLQNRFAYHPPVGDQVGRHEQLRAAGLILAAKVTGMTPSSREQSLALIHIEEAIMWANAAIARNETLKHKGVAAPPAPSQFVTADTAVTCPSSESHRFGYKGYFGEPRWCPKCNNYERVCGEDHCMVCGSAT